MQLNIDCVRALLLSLEKNLQFSEDMNYPVTFFKDIIDKEPLNNFSHQDIAYTTLKLIEAGYINAAPYPGQPFSGAIYKSITYEGHEFLDTVRNEGVWSEGKAKINAKGISSVALDIMSQVCASIIASKLGF